MSLQAFHQLPERGKTFLKPLASAFNIDAGDDSGGKELAVGAFKIAAVSWSSFF